MAALIHQNRDDREIAHQQQLVQPLQEVRRDRETVDADYFAQRIYASFQKSVRCKCLQEFSLHKTDKVLPHLRLNHGGPEFPAMPALPAVPGCVGRTALYSQIRLGPALDG